MEHNSFSAQVTNIEAKPTTQSLPVGRIIAIFLLYFFLTVVLMGVLPFTQSTFRSQLFSDPSAIPAPIGAKIFIGLVLVMNGFEIAILTFAPVFLILLLVHFYLRKNNMNYAKRSSKLELFSLYLLSLLVSLGIILIFGGSFEILSLTPRFH